MITQDRLKEVLLYDPERGIFTWCENMSPRACSGSLAGHVRTDGHIGIGIDGFKYLAHNLAWLYVYGTCPKRLKHRDGKKRNNAITNLVQTKRDFR